MDKNKIFQQPMQPWPALDNFGKSIKLFDGDLTLFYYEAGFENPRNLILIHGLGDEADTWRHIITPLSEDFHIIAMDLPGFGRSELPEEKITPVLIMNCLLELFKAKGIESAILIGSSLGGVLAHALGLKYPNKIKGIILVGGTLLQSEPMGDFGLRLMQIPLLGEWLYTRLRKDPQAAYHSLGNVYHEIDQMPKADQAFLSTRVNKRVWSDKQRQAFFSKLRNFAPWLKHVQAELPAQLEHLQTPTLVLRGIHDRLFSIENAKRLVGVQPNTVFIQIEEAGHLPHQEAPADFLRVLRFWLGEHFG